MINWSHDAVVKSVSEQVHLKLLEERVEHRKQSVLAPINTTSTTIIPTTITSRKIDLYEKDKD